MHGQHSTLSETRRAVLIRSRTGLWDFTTLGRPCTTMVQGGYPAVRRLTAVLPSAMRVVRQTDRQRMPQWRRQTAVRVHAALRAVRVGEGVARPGRRHHGFKKHRGLDPELRCDATQADEAFRAQRRAKPVLEVRRGLAHDGVSQAYAGDDAWSVRFRAYHAPRPKSAATSATIRSGPARCATVTSNPAPSARSASPSRTSATRRTPALFTGGCS